MSSKQQTKQKHKSNHQKTELPPHTQPCLPEEKQINKYSVQISTYMKLSQTTGPTLGVQKQKGRKDSTLKLGKRKPQTQ